MAHVEAARNSCGCCRSSLDLRDAPQRLWQTCEDELAQVIVVLTSSDAGQIRSVLSGLLIC